ncbi:MAG: cell division protein FtsQ/DivIB [Elusimicrobiota bacterium]|nr:cell division protein FtsQ/DivIB [Elusimicrobiota bacterium]
MNNPNGRRRFRVLTRPKQKARRARVAAAFLVVAALGGVAFVTVRKLASDFRLPFAPVSGAADAALVEGPEPLRSLAQAAADAVSGTAGDKAEVLKARFPSISDVRVRRNWTEKTATLTLVVRRAVASATRRGKPSGFLGDDGVVFEAPQGAFMLTGPSVEVAGASPAELSALAREWPILAASGSFPAELTGMAYGSPENGWEATLSDGTKVLWGRLEWTREKLSRLSEAVADARSKEPGAFSADLRWFEDGKVLLKPAAVQVGKLR